MEEVETNETELEVKDDLDLNSGVDNEVETTEDEFDPDKMFDEEELVSYNFGIYNLEKFKDVLDFENQELHDEFNSYVLDLEAKGFTQEQVEFMLEREIAKPEPEKNKEDVKEVLKKSLTIEEKRNYSNINNFVTDMIAGTEFEESKNDIMQNPALVKLFNQIYKKSLSKTGSLNNLATKSKEKQIKSLDYETAMSKVKDSLAKKGDTRGLVSSLINSVSDKEKFIAVTKAMGLTQ